MPSTPPCVTRSRAACTDRPPVHRDVMAAARSSRGEACAIYAFVMPSPLIVSARRAVPAELDEVFRCTLTTPLPQLFSRRYGVLPAITDVTGFTPPWGSVGQSRTIRTADGGSMRETLLQIDGPRSFSYQIGSITGPMVALIASVEGTWSFEPAGTGTRVGWSWTIRAANGASALVLPVFGRMWGGYARQALEELEKVLVA